MIICGQDFTSNTIDQIQSIVSTDPALSRRQLSRQVCDALNWRCADGRPKVMSCRKALLSLQRRGLLTLPENNEQYAFNNKRIHGQCPDTATLDCQLYQLGQVSVLPVTSRYCKAHKDWINLMDSFHYLGSGPLCGAQIRYMVQSSTYGYLGALAFNSATFALKERDRFIGWNENARRANLDKVVCNSRFLILPTVKVNNLASHVLSLATSRLRNDWHARYHVRPVLVETFVDPSRFAGTCYKAANWQRVGQSAGRRDGQHKDIFVYPLTSSWRPILCKEPLVKLGQAPRPESVKNWAEQEFGAARLYDQRLKQRLYQIGQDFYADPQANIPQACGSKAKTMGAYRFFANPKVTMDVVLDAHTQASIDRIKEHKVVLAPQDTTTLNYSTHPMTQDLGPINSTSDTLVGLLLHDTLAFTEDGIPLGVLDAQCWARDPKDRGKKYRRKTLPIEQKESIKWLRSYQRVAQVQKLCPDTMLVSTGDRESDIYELFQMATKDPCGPKLLVRADKNRNRKVDDQLLWDFMCAQPVSGTLKLHVPRSGSRKARDTRIDIRFAKIELPPPQRLSSHPPITLWAVYAFEAQRQDVATPIEWMLLTTVETNSFEDAKKRVQWYSGRWGIEVYHRTLKSGCRIKDRQLQAADRLETCLGIDMVVAWRIYHMTMLGRQVPDCACTAVFEQFEWKALCCYVNQTSVAPDKPPTMKEAIFMLGKIGGHLGRKSDGYPGPQVLWRGLCKLYGAAQMYAILTQSNPHPHQSGP